MRFETTLLKIGNNTGVVVPEEVLLALDAGKKPPVVVTIGDFTYRSSIASMGGRYLIAFSAANRAATGLVGGEDIEVELVLDDAPRVVEVPDDLAAALDAEPAAKAFYETLSYSNKRKHVEPIVAAKAPETRARRIEKSIASFLDGKA